MPQPPRISRYEIKSPLGGGGMGTLYLARDTNPTTDRLVALKLLKANLDSGDLRARFAREAQSLARLNHPNIVNIYDSGEYRGAPFIVMEYVRGETLAEKLKRKTPRSLSHNLKWLAELCSGLAHAHDTGVIHRDIKPANLMVDQQGRLKIVDFGIARVADSLTRVSPQVTQHNMQVGTPGYMSPEQIEGTDVDARSDLFAVGAVAYELLTGQEAFAGANTKQIERKVLQAQPPPLLTLVQGLPQGIADIVNKALEKDPNLRYQDALSMEEAFQEQRTRLGQAETPVPPRLTPPPVSPKARGSRADVAYGHAVAMLHEGAPEAARRYVLEALAEDSAHTEANALFAEINGGALPFEPTAVGQSLSRGAPARVAGSGSLPSLDDLLDQGDGFDPTVVVRPVRTATPVLTLPPARPSPGRDSFREERTEYASRRDDFSPGELRYQDPTIVARPKPKPAAPAPSKRPTPLPRRFGLADLPHPRDWSPRTRLLAVALPLVLVAAAGGLWLWRPWATGHLLTVTRPAGGTLITTGISCGEDGTRCSAAFSNAEVLQFEARAQEGFTLTAFIGDCAPDGRTMMDGPRECGATFERSGAAVVGGPGEMLLTVAPPTGGTIVGFGIQCRSDGKACSAKLGAGVDVRLEGHPDPGYSLQGFAGDCGFDGTTIMTGPRTCGATFVGSPPGKLAAGPNQPAPGPLGRPGETHPPAAPASAASSTGGRTLGGAGTGGGPGNAGPAANLSGSGATPANPGGAPTGPGANNSTAGPGTNAPVTGGIDPSKPVAPVITIEQASRNRIGESLEKYLAAYGKLDYEELREVYPSASPDVRRALEQYKSMEYSFGGPPSYLTLDAEGGAAQVELAFKQVVKVKVGTDPKEPLEGKVTFQMRRHQNNDWLIDKAQFKFKKTK